MTSDSPTPTPDNPAAEPETLEIPLTPRAKACAVIFVVLVVVGGISVGRSASRWLMGRLTEAGIIVDTSEAAILARIPISELPGPPRDTDLKFELDDANSALMYPHNDPAQERWADIAGNYYSETFIKSFSYEHPGVPSVPKAKPLPTPPAATPTEDGAAVTEAPEAAPAAAEPVTPSVPLTAPYVRVSYSPKGASFTGRIEAHGLKPNFAYQMKLRGAYDIDRDSFAIIGALGRWRLPGRETNFTDADFTTYPHKNLVEAYILFDYFVTDKDGNAVREFDLNASLHVLWDATRQEPPRNLIESHLVAWTVDASSPADYARPKETPSTQLIWAERERGRYDDPNQLIRLPATKYRALLVLTEETFHSTAADGGWWPTVYALPVEFEITL